MKKDSFQKGLRRASQITATVVGFAAIYFLAYWIRFGGKIESSAFGTFFLTLPWVLIIKVVAFDWFRVFQGWKRHVTFHDLLVVGQAATTSAVVLAVSDYLLFPNIVVPRSVFLMDWGATIMIIGGLRAGVRAAKEHSWIPRKNRASIQRILIVGANDSGGALLREIRLNPQLPYGVVGFIAGDQDSTISHIDGVPVLGLLDDTCRLAARHDISKVFITAGELSGRQVRQLVDDAHNHNIAVEVLPSYQQLLQGQIDMRPRAVSIGDLLHRDPVDLDVHRLHQWLDDRVCLVTGSAGSIGSEICRQLLAFHPKKIIVLDRCETGQFFLERELTALAPHLDIEICVADINDEERIRNVFSKARPDIVFHAAAYKHVPLMESHPGEAVKNIVLATQSLANLSEEFNVASFVMISTDKAVNPTSVMGACKRSAELYVQSLADTSNCRFVTVRFGNVLDSAGSVVPIFREQIAGGGPVCVTHPDMMRYFMTIPEASQLVIQAGAMGAGGEIFVLDMGAPIRIVDLAHDMIRLSGLRAGEDIEVKFIGLRPGEKLFEELRADGEQHVATDHPKIMITDAHRRDLGTIRLAIERLRRAANADTAQLGFLLQELVPEYKRRRDQPDLLEQKAA